MNTGKIMSDSCHRKLKYEEAEEMQARLQQAESQCAAMRETLISIKLHTEKCCDSAYINKLAQEALKEWGK